MEKTNPTIKGLFVNCHIKQFKIEKGEKALKELEEKYGKSLRFGNLDDVPVEEEVKIVDLILDLLHGDAFPAQKKAFEAGKLHFKNFLTTTVAKLVFTHSRANLKLTFLWADRIGSHIFKGVQFKTEDVGKQTVRISMFNSPYPLEHFQGFLEEWIHELGYIGSVDAQHLAPGTYTYIVDWH